MVIHKREIRPLPSSANWLQVTDLDGYVTVTRTNTDGERMQTLLVQPEELGPLIDALASARREAA